MRTKKERDIKANHNRDTEGHVNRAILGSVCRGFMFQLLDSRYSCVKGVERQISTAYALHVDNTFLQFEYITVATWLPEKRKEKRGGTQTPTQHPLKSTVPASAWMHRSRGSGAPNTVLTLLCHAHIWLFLPVAVSRDDREKPFRPQVPKPAGLCRVSRGLVTGPRR